MSSGDLIVGLKLNRALKAGDDQITLQVHESGLGLSADAEKRGGMGLTNVRYRAELIEGSLTMTSRDGQGTTLTLSLARSS
jgi:signal transduction histidine kinase